MPLSLRRRQEQIKLFFSLIFAFLSTILMAILSWFVARETLVKRDQDRKNKQQQNFKP